MLKTSKRFNRRRQKGFTLIEAVFSIVIIGLGVVSLMQLFASGTEVNAYGNQLSSAVIFAEQVRAATDETDFFDLAARHGETFNGAEGLEGFQSQLQVEAVNPADMTVYVGPDPEMMRLSAVVTFNGKEITRLSWLRSW